MSETTINRSALAPTAQLARSAAARASAQTNRLAVLSQPNAALQDMQEEISFAFGERLEKRNALKEKIQERSHKLLKEFAEKVQRGHVVDDKVREPLERKIENKMQSFSRHEDSETLWHDMENFTADKATLFAALEDLKQKSLTRGDKGMAERYLVLQERCALSYESHIRAAINLTSEIHEFAQQHDLESEKVLDAYQSSVADYSGILHAALDLTEKLGLQRSEAGAAFIRQNAGKEISMLTPSVSPEQLLHVLAELKGLQVLATLKEQVEQHRDTMTRSEKNETPPQQATIAAGAKKTGAKEVGAGITMLSAEALVKGVLHSAVAPQSFAERLDRPASSAYEDKPSGLIMHFQGLHKIFKSLPDYAFVDKIDKQRALLPLETRLDSLVAREREAML